MHTFVDQELMQLASFIRILLPFTVKTRRRRDLIVCRGEYPLVEPGHDVLPPHQEVQRVHRVRQLIPVNSLLDDLQKKLNQHVDEKSL